MIAQKIKWTIGCLSILGAMSGFTQTESTASSEPVTSKQATAHASQVFFRGAFSALNSSRGGEVFTDTGTGGNNGKNGYALSAGIDLALTKPAQIFNHITLLGEVFMEYSKHSRKKVLQTTSALLAGTNQASIEVAEMNATIAPKVRFDSFGSVRPFVIPFGMTWLVNSPPSNDTTYLDMGIPFAAGLDVVLAEQLSVGLDFRYTMAFNHTNTENSYYTLGGYAAVNF